MILYGDYHTHTPYSHGKGTILENAKVASSKGLKEIAITDHSFNHKLYGIKRSDIAFAKKEIADAQKQTGVKILFGVEANFTGADGSIDVTNQDFSQMDILLVGHHNFVKANTMRDKYSMFYRNMLSGIWAPSKQKIEKNTAVYLRSLEKNRIDVFTHLNHGMKVNAIEIARACKAVGTYIELNGKRILFTDEELTQMAREGVKFIINSDAHEAKNVGECNLGLNVVRRLEIPVDLVVNVNKLPIFNKSR